MNMKELTITQEAAEGFYPTPKAVADTLLSGIDWCCISNVLEPSAGKGDLAYEIATKFCLRDVTRGSIDLVEKDPYLRSILQYRFGGQREAEISHKMEQIRDAERKAGNYYEPNSYEFKQLQFEYRSLNAAPCRIVHDDFLSFDTRKRYDLIVMNPPFADGDAHLLKALSLMKDYGGDVRCVLNAETIRNPYTNRRKALLAKLHELDAEISYMESGFLDAERPTEVAVALVKVHVPQQQRESEIFSRLRKASGLEDTPVDGVKDLVATGDIDQMVAYFNMEVDAGLRLIQEYMAMRPYLMSSFKQTHYTLPTLTLSVCNGNSTYNDDLPNGNEYLKKVRNKYWRGLLENSDLLDKYTSNLRSKYLDMVEELADYDFSLYNIQAVLQGMNAEMTQSVKDTIVALFDELTTEHSWYPETAKNIHYYNGWATNKAHKINSKVILPVNGMFSDYSWSKTFEVNHACEVLEDIEKVFEYLDGNLTAPVSLRGALQSACDEGKTKNIECKFFDVTLYKKGTMHLKFKNPKLLERFNLYCGKEKAWLPPVYGKVRYEDMKEDAKAVVDSFHGTGEPGSGEAGYQEVMANAAYFLAPPAGSNTMLSLGA